MEEEIIKEKKNERTEGKRREKKEREEIIKEEKNERTEGKRREKKEEGKKKTRKRRKNRIERN